MTITPQPLPALTPIDPGLADLPGLALRQVRRAEAWLARGETAYADGALAEALRLAPDHPELLRMRALVLHRQKRYAEATDLLRRAIAQRPDDAVLHNNLGGALGESGDLKAAAAELERACELAPDQASSWFNLGKARDALLCTADAEQAFAEALARDPAHLEAQILHADTLKTMGRIDDAVAGFREALRMRPDCLEAWTGLVSMKAITPDADDLATLQRLHENSDIPLPHRISIGYARGLALEANDRLAEAFDVIVAANAAKRRTLQWDAARCSAVVTSILAAFEQPASYPAASAAAEGGPAVGNDVVMLFGLPRSGSTLAEQILSAHGDVESIGEAGALSAILREESSRRGIDFPDWATDATAADWARLGEEYLARTARLRPGHARMFTDKTLSTWQLIGAAHAMLPAAHFVDCRRDPVETCWSCYKHDFGDAQPFSRDFAELAAWWHDYDRSVAFWNWRYPGLVYRHDYEALIATPETQIRQLLEHCGLAFDPACLRFHEARRDVRTASSAQVRQPLRSDTARSQHYGALLDPLRAALAAHDSADNDAPSATARDA